jgi:hypothetical protein
MVVYDTKPDHAGPLRFSESQPREFEAQRYTAAQLVLEPVMSS